MEFLVIVFKSVHFAIKGEHILKGKFSIKIMPTPREISSSCGVSIRIEKDDMDQITALLGAEIETFTVFDINKAQGETTVDIVYKKE